MVKYLMFSLIVLCGILWGKCLKSEETKQQHSCLLQVHQSASTQNQVTTKFAHHRSKFTPAHGNGGNLGATTDGFCLEDAYLPSVLEQNFSAQPNELTKDEATLCKNLAYAHVWIQENVEGTLNSESEIFSRLCKKGRAPQLLEPLAGILRDPRVICEPFDEHNFFGIDWLVVADQLTVKPSAKKILFDAGGTRFMDAMQFFTRQYERRGIVPDQIYVWEYDRQGTEAYWNETPAELRQMWEPRLLFYDGVPVRADPDSEDNPVNRILQECEPDDFCAFKLDIDTPSVEFPLIEQILASQEVASRLDEFFFEHHVHGLMEDWGWDKDVNGTFADSYNLFTRMRQMGVRAHSWI